MSTVVKDLGAATAYGYAVEKGYTGTEEEFAELMASYATVGHTAVTAAQTATTKASEAATSAIIATNKASEATTAAQTASTKASEAVGCVETATQKATEATQSASQALGYKNDAESAKTASQTAQGLAESARDSAISAKNDAESARDDAQDIVDGINAKAEQIDTNTADIAELESTKADLSELYKAFPTDTASGAVASFADGANVPVKSLIVNIDPVQSGSGDPSPSNVRPISGWSEVNVNACGANVLNESSFTQYGSVKQSDGSWFTTNLYNFYGKIAYTPPTGYTGQLAVTFKRKTESGKQSLRLIINYSDGTTTTLGFFNATGNWDTYTKVTDGSKTVANIKYDYGSGAATYFNLLVAFATTATAYEPYSGQSITIALGQTVYGGKLDMLSGELTVYPYYASYNGETLTGEWISDRDKYVSGTTPTIGAQVVNIGAEGTEIQLEPHEVESLYGVNNLWADSGDTEVEYRADTKLFIERLTAPDSADMIADANITSGKYFMVGNSLYKATANIANGASIIVGTNCIRKSLSEALNEINA